MASAHTDSSSSSTLLPKPKQQGHQPYEGLTAPPPSSNMEKGTNADSSRASFELPLTGHPEAIHSLSPQMKRRTTFEQQAEHAATMERRIKRHWYPALVLSIALNVFLVVGAFYVIYEAEYYKVSRHGYLLRAFLIIFVPLVPIAILLFWPWEGHWKTRRDAFIQRKSSPRWPYVVNICNALGCFALTILYLMGAIPKYNQPVWESAVDFPGNVTVPTVAMMTVDSLTGTGIEAVQFRSEAEGGSQFVAWGATGNSVQLFEDPDTYSVERVAATDDYPLAVLANVANISREQTEYGSALQTSLQVRAQTTYNSTIVDEAADASLTRVAPSVLIAAYDKRLTLEEALYCNIVQQLTPLAFQSVTYLISVSQISDPRRKMTPPTLYASACERVYNELLPHADPPLAIFDLSLMASTPLTTDYETDCDVATSANASCLSAVMLTYGTQFINYQKSVPGKTKMEIWIDCGAIVGAVQFFAWFLYTFFQP